MTKLESVLDSNQPVKSTEFDLDDTTRPITIQ